MELIARRPSLALFALSFVLAVAVGLPLYAATAQPANPPISNPTTPCSGVSRA